MKFEGELFFLEGILKMINFKLKCLEITTYAKTPMK